jgi:hypothetical protein
MKTATIPPMRMESAFREEIEQSLEAGETMAALVEHAVIEYKIRDLPGHSLNADCV